MTDIPGFGGEAPDQRIRNKLPHISNWLVTKQNPPRLGIGLDYRRCAALHNYILKFVEESMIVINVPGSRCYVTWFDDLPEWRQKTLKEKGMKPGTIRFLKTASHNRKLIFFHGKTGLSTYEDMLASMNHYKKGSFILYGTDLAGDKHPHSGKVLYNQTTCKALIIPENADIRFFGKFNLWRPLEVILSAWIEMIHVGKMTSRYSPDLVMPGGQLGAVMFNKWTNYSFGQEQMIEAADAFQLLLKQIRCRMIVDAGVALGSGFDRGPLFDRADLHAAKIPKHCFAELFLLKIRTPPDGLLYIAPGIRAPYKEMTTLFQQQLLSPTASTNIPSIMLFPADEIRNSDQLEQSEDQYPENVHDTTASHSSVGNCDQVDSMALKGIPLPAGVYSAEARFEEDNAERRL
ncbi:hypothetical protein ONS96_003978 [Cadophora gregata f. sp. sojae]|nr:hypothetical protein ONS96_003978 [Cadophora gregata f. sp. sojae]